MELQSLSPYYSVRKLDAGDAELIFDLCSQNEMFYRYHPPFVTRESILEDMRALPPGTEPKDKLYIGFFQGGALIALMDLILDYPRDSVAYIGLFMMHTAFQGRGLGTEIIGDCSACLSRLGFQKIRLAIDRGNPQSEAFWTKNQFVKTGEEIPNKDSAYLPMERILN